MAYIGRQGVIGNFVKLDAITAVNGQAAYTMQNGGSNFTDYESVNQFLVSLNGTIQAPTDSFTVSGSTLTFASNLSTGDVIDFIMVFGNSLSAGTPTDATITSAKLASQDITFPENVKLADDKKVTFGAGNDLTIHHNSSNNVSFIEETGSSALHIRGDNIVLKSQVDNDDFIKCKENDAVELYHSNAKKLETISTGLNITGGIRLGGNNAANELDDYEEGTWTPAVTTGSISDSYGFYTKIGNTVHFTMITGLYTDTSTSSDVELTLPFTSQNVNNKQNHVVVMSRYLNISNKSITGYINQNSNKLKFFINGNSSNGWVGLQHSDFSSGQAYLRISGFFYAD